MKSRLLTLHGWSLVATIKETLTKSHIWSFLKMIGSFQKLQQHQNQPQHSNQQQPRLQPRLQPQPQPQSKPKPKNPKSKVRHPVKLDFGPLWCSLVFTLHKRGLACFETELGTPQRRWLLVHLVSRNCAFLPLLADSKEFALQQNSILSFFALDLFWLTMPCSEIYWKIKRTNLLS